MVTKMEPMGSELTRLQIPTVFSRPQKKFPKLLKLWQDNKPSIKYSLSCSLMIWFRWPNSRSAGRGVKRHKRTTNTLTLHEYSAVWREVQRGNVTLWHAPWKWSQRPSSLALRYIHLRQFSSRASEFARLPAVGVLCWPLSEQMLGCCPWRTTTLGFHEIWPSSPARPNFITIHSLCVTDAD